MAIERQDLSQLYPGFAPAKPNNRTSIPLSFASFELQERHEALCLVNSNQQVETYLPKQLSVRFEA